MQSSHPTSLDGLLVELLGGELRYRVLRALLEHPEKEMHLRGLAAVANVDPGNAHRMLKRLVDAGWVEQAQAGASLKYKPRTDNPLYTELLQLFSRRTAEEEGLSAPLDTSRTRPQLERKFALGIARKYLWWVPPAKAVKDQDRLVAQVMNLGTFEDARRVENDLGQDYLREVFLRANRGQIQERARTYWGHRLGVDQRAVAPERAPRRRAP
jgi:hypothetical protein